MTDNSPATDEEVEAAIKAVALVKHQAGFTSADHERAVMRAALNAASRIRAETAKNSGEVVCQTCDGRGEVGGYQRFGDGDVDCVIEPCPVCATPAKNSGKPDRDMFGRLVRETWVRWAETQPSPKSTWLVPYDELSEPDKEADRQIGEAMFRWSKAYLESANVLIPSSHANSRAEAIGVKPLEWEEIGSGFYRAKAPLFGNIRVEKYGTRFTVCYSLPGYSDTFTPGDFATAEAAKAAAQADYERRIRSALLDTPQPDSRAEAIGVKPLEWEYREQQIMTYVHRDERGIIYHINQTFGSDSYYFTSVRFDGEILYDGDDLPSAKDAAQADYEQRIRSALLQQEGE